VEDEHFEGAEEFFQTCRQLKGKKVGIVGHAQIDGDAVGAQIALFEILRNLAGEPFLIEPETGIPDHLQFLYEGYRLHRPSELSVEEWCVVDCGLPSRPGKFFESLRPFLLVDHHLPRPTFALHNFVHPRAAATCEILADYLHQKNFPISPSVARALYVGLIMDTGNYTYDSVRASTLRLGAWLLDQGLRPQALAARVYHQEPRRKFSLLERFLKSWKFYADDQLCFGFLREEDYRSTGCGLKDAEGFVNYPRSVRGVRISGLLQEYEGTRKISLRSDESALRLDQIAQRFRGGGHPCAAGFLTPASPDSFWDELVRALQERLRAVERASYEG
jgi:phosphoesterase RecJ-like protein